MTKKQIEKKAKEIANQWQEPSDYNIARDAATEMAEWLLSHQWVSVEDELPPAYITVLVKTKYYSYFVAHYSARFEDFLCGAVGIANVTHWMPIPLKAEEGGDR